MACAHVRVSVRRPCSVNIRCSRRRRSSRLSFDLLAPRCERQRESPNTY
jgi:hypothetical protein